MTSWNNFKGVAKPLDDIDLPKRGAEIGVGEDELHAFMDTETRGKGFDSSGRPVILFEPHVFYRNLAGTKRDAAVAAGLAYPKWGEKPYPKDSYPRLLKAIDIDETAALKAASWGLFQVLGENYAMAGYDTPQAMVLAFMADEENHLEACIKFLIAAHIDDDLRAHRWSVVARVYNGPGYAKNQYDVKMASAYAKWAKIPDTPWTPTQALPTVTGENLYDGKPHPEVESVQRKLDTLGYPEVGAFDGKWGTKTRAAVLAFRADNGLPLDPLVDQQLLAALMVAKPRPVSPARAEATVADLRAMGAPEVHAADLSQAGGVVLAGGGILGTVSPIIQQAQQYSDMFSQVSGIVGTVQGFITDNLWLLLLAIGGIVVYEAWRIKRVRLLKHQTGQDVSE